MAEVRAAAGVPTTAAFAGLGAPTQCAPLFVDSSTGWIYSLKTGDVVVPAGMGGTVTSVAMTVPAQFSIGGSPVTASGTLALSWQTQAANRVLSGPTTGAAAAPTFRALVAADIPAAALTKADDTNVTLTLGGAPASALVNAASITAGWAGTLSVARGGTGQGTHSPALLDAALTPDRVPIATTDGRLTDGPAPVADGTYDFETASGKVASLTFTKGIATAVVVTP